MRIILFRGKTESGEWAEGNLLIYPDVNRAYIQKGDYFKGGAIEVKRSTVGQYSGLNDKNGKGIFEGDILRWTGEDGETGKVFVIFAGGAFMLQCVEVADADPDPFSQFEIGNQTLEVIGNIHDNPELLKGGDG